MRRILLLLFAVCLAIACLALAGERVRGIVRNTAILSAAATSIALPIGLVVAVVLVKTDALGRRWLLAGFGVLLFMPLYLHVAGWQAALGVAGWWTLPPETGLTQPWIDGWRGAIWIHALAAIPWVVWIIAAGLNGAPAAPEEEASLSAAPWQVLRQITLPAATPAIAVATLWVLVSVATEMTVTDFFQVRTFAEEVYTQAAAGGFPTDNPEEDYAPWRPFVRASGLIGGVGLLATIACLALALGHPWLTQASGSCSRAPWQWKLGRGRAFATAVPSGILALVAGLPLASLVHQAGVGSTRVGENWQRFWSFRKLVSELTRSLDFYSRELWQTLWLGLAVATAATAIGLLAAWHLRSRSSPPLGLLTLFALAMATPGPLLGIAAIHLLNHPAGSFWYPLTVAYDQTLLAPWLVQTVRFTPVAAILLAAGFASVPANLMEAAKSDGAGWVARLVWIALPIAWPMVVVAWLVTLALSAGEVAATLLVLPPGTPTLAIRLFGLLHYGADDQVAAVSIVLLAAVSLLAAVAVGLGGNRRKKGPAMDRTLAKSPN